MAPIAARILLVRPWHLPIDLIVASLRISGIDPTITRVDIEPALHAALVRGDQDIVLYDPKTKGLPVATVEAIMKQHAPNTPLVVIDDVQDIGTRVMRLLALHRN